MTERKYKYKRCNICGEFGFSDRHRCPPQFDVRRASDGEDWDRFYASDAEEAAEKWAEQHDQNTAEYSIVSQRDEPEVEVRKVGTDEIEMYVVSGEAVPCYYATKQDAS